MIWNTFGGDDWNDSPYEDNAGEPYDYWSELIEDNPNIWERKWKHNPINLKALYYETDLNEMHPCDQGHYSVEDINKGKVAWISTSKFTIYAGTTYKDFIKIIEDNDGVIYLPKRRDVKNAR